MRASRAGEGGKREKIKQIKRKTREFVPFPCCRCHCVSFSFSLFFLFANVLRKRKSYNTFHYYIEHCALHHRAAAHNVKSQMIYI